MNNELFLKRLSEVSHWHRPKLGPSGAVSVNKRNNTTVEHPGMISLEELESMSDQEIEQYHEQLMAWKEAQPNESVPPEIKELIYQPKACEDCGLTVTCRRTQRRMCWTNDYPHWREHCVNCGLYKNPNTKEFNLSSHESQNVFKIWIRAKLRKLATF